MDPVGRRTTGAARLPPRRRAGVGGRASSAGARQMSGACTLEGAPINLRALREHGKSALCDALDSVPGKKILVLDQSLAGCARTRTRTSRPQPTACARNLPLATRTARARGGMPASLMDVTLAWCVQSVESHRGEEGAHRPQCGRHLLCRTCALQQPKSPGAGC